MGRNYLFTFLSLFFSAQTLTAQSAQAQDFHIQRINPNVLAFRGNISEGSVLALQDQIDANTTSIYITSVDGDMIEAMRLGKLLRERNLELVIQSYCLSRCAQYVFTASPRKSLNKNALLGFTKIKPIDNADALREQFGKLDNSLLNLTELRTNTMSAEQLNLTEWRYFKELNILPNVLSLFDQKLAEAIGSQKNLTSKAVLEAPSSFSAVENIAVPNQIDRNIMRASRPRSSGKAEIKAEQAVYFPSLSVLESVGIKGVQHYVYPQTVDELRDLLSEDLPQIKAIAYTQH